MTKPMQKFSTGAVRENKIGKGRFDLISPLAMQRLAAIYEEGAQDHAPRNWEQGLPLSSCINSAKRHLDQYISGERDIEVVIENCSDCGETKEIIHSLREDHLARALWNIVAAVHIDECIRRGVLPAELMDLPDYTEEGRGDITPLYSDKEDDESWYSNKDLGKMAEAFVTQEELDTDDYPSCFGDKCGDCWGSFCNECHLNEEGDEDLELDLPPVTNKEWEPEIENMDQVMPGTYVSKPARSKTPLPIGSRVVNSIGLKGTVKDIDFMFPNHRIVQFDSTPGIPAKVHLMELQEE